MRRSPSPLLVLGFLVAGLATACSAPSSAAPGPSQGGGSSAAGSSPSSSGSGGSGATPAPVASSPGSSAIVDLTITGAASVTAKGSKGCALGKDASGAVTHFGFAATEADYPGLGQGLYIDEDANHLVTIKWLQSASVGYIDNGKGYTVSADHKSITLDADMGTAPNAIHLAGQIVCP